MGQQSFDAFTRLAAAEISRRRSLAALGGAGAALAAGLAGPLGADARKSAAKKAKKKIRKKCKKQVGQCKTFIQNLCEEQNTEPEECEDVLECCEFLGQCNTTAFLQCLVAVQ